MIQSPTFVGCISEGVMHRFSQIWWVTADIEL